MTEGKVDVSSSVQTDLFCSCGYNLYAQVVHVDERLGIPLCRCPECGRHHAMNTLQPSQAPWVARAGMLVILLYLLVVLWGAVWLTIGIGAMEYGFVAAVEESVRYGQRLHSYRSPNLEQSLVLWLGEIMFVLCAMAGFIYMMMATVFFWHWRSHSYWRVLLVPILAGAVVFWIGIENHDRAFLQDTSMLRMAIGVLAVMLGMGLGVRWSRAAARGLLSLVLPPRARQSLAFLWLADGKQPVSPAQSTLTSGSIETDAGRGS